MNKEKYYVYIITNTENNSTVTGVTNNLEKIQNSLHSVYKSEQHSNNAKLVYYEYFSDIKEALLREQEINRRTSHKRNSIISWFNPEWEDLVRDFRKN